MRNSIIRLGLTLLMSAVLCGALQAGPEYVFVRGDRTPVSKLPAELRALITSLDTGTAADRQAIVAALRQAVTGVEGGRYYVERANDVYAEFDETDVLSFAREYALWNRFIKDYPMAAQRGELVFAKWLLAMDRVLAVSELDRAADGFQQVADGLANPASELERQLRDAAAKNAQALMQHR